MSQLVSDREAGDCETPLRKKPRKESDYVGIEISEYEEPRFARFLVGPSEKEFTIHCGSLKGLSQYFCALVEGQIREASEGVVKWPHVDNDTFSRFAEFVYTGEYNNPQIYRRSSRTRVPSHDDLVAHLRLAVLADSYDISALEKLAMDKLLKSCDLLYKSMDWPGQAMEPALSGKSPYGPETLVEFVKLCYDPNELVPGKILDKVSGWIKMHPKGLGSSEELRDAINSSHRLAAALCEGLLSKHK
ncbi:hypothetical protein NLU13_5223 [Sarocladium strictum]|uniref:BTB domain-containing protein n=1 Tax=Sarocladium strictum TaxID=5046 RepID=A0AA39GGH2_SARSR|nr:hypothetical protein NLU13_5223 [Sarocladium strictum]